MLLNMRDIKLNQEFVDTICIIVNKNNTRMLTECINSMLKYIDSNKFKLVICDTGSEFTEKVLQKKMLKKYLSLGLDIVIEYNHKYNFSKNNNDMFDKYNSDLKYKYVLFCNNDIDLINDVFKQYHYIAENYPKVGALGCQLFFPNGLNQHAGIIAEIDFNKDVKFGHKLYKESKEDCDVKSMLGVTGALMMMKSSVFKEFKFNEDYMVYQDVELCLNLIDKGYENIYIGTALAYHKESQTRREDNIAIQNDLLHLKQDYDKINKRFKLNYRNYKDFCYGVKY